MEEKNFYVELKNIEKSFGKVKASDEVSFSVEKGKLVGLLGPSGSGKTTILRILAGLEDAEKGEIYIAGQQVNQVKVSKRGVGFVFQNYALFRYKTVYDNIAFGLKIAKWKKADIKERVEEFGGIERNGKTVSQSIIWWTEAESGICQSACYTTTAFVVR